jgi:hypothetical protein
LPCLSAQLGELLLLAGGQSGEITLFDGCLTDPVAQARLADAQALGQRGN